jgi:hypothetical protein
MTSFSLFAMNLVHPFNEGVGLILFGGLSTLCGMKNLHFISLMVMTSSEIQIPGFQKYFWGSYSTLL